ncbi:MAG: hypothetical protein IAF94_16780 [Pirellulaceae bacterium]|nr:hypothetical protein [Pirellulaceae bacterium]
MTNITKGHQCGNAQIRPDKDEVKVAARGHWSGILSAVARIPAGLLDGKHHPCPKCAGTDRFRAFDDFAETGGVICNVCFDKKNGDGFAAIEHFAGCDFRTALTSVADHLGLIRRPSRLPREEVLPLLAKKKNVPVESLLAYGANVRGQKVHFPTFGANGERQLDFRIWPASADVKEQKGKFESGKKTGKKAGFFTLVKSDNPRLPQPGETWLVCEGVKEPAAAHSLGFPAIGMPTKHLNQKHASMLKGVHLILVAHRDVPGQDGVEVTGATALTGGAASIKVAILPGEIQADHGADLRDCLALPNGEEIAKAAIANAVEWVPRPVTTTEKPEIKMSPEEHKVADEAVAALAKLGSLYQWARSLVETAKDAKPPVAVSRQPGGMYPPAISEAGMWDKLSQAASFFQEIEIEGVKEKRYIAPPTRIAKIILARTQWKDIPTLEGIVHAPVFLADGTVLATPGYCQKSGLYLEDGEFPAVPESPILDDAKRARDELLEIVCDFPFATEAHRAAWLAMAITPSARHAIDGCVPLGAFDANIPGSGKSKGADCIGMIHLGRELPRTSAPVTDDEFRKRITATLLAGDPLMLIDNIAGVLGCSSLDAVLTGTTWTDRLLGVSKMTGTLQAKTIWLATGNNLVFGADLSRRVLHIRLDSKEENPEERHGFRHPQLLPWVRQNRGRLAAAAVTLLRAYHVAGRPSMKLKEWGGFEGWSNLVRNAVVWAGMSDPGETRQEVRQQSDNSAAFIRQLLAAWELADPNGHGLSVSQAITDAAHIPELQSVFAEIGTPGKPPNPRSIGMKLNHMKGRVAGGKCLKRREGSGHIAFWSVQAVENQGTKGTKGTNPSPSYAGENEIQKAMIGKQIACEGAGISPLSPPSPQEERKSHSIALARDTTPLLPTPPKLSNTLPQANCESPELLNHVPNPPRELCKLVSASKSESSYESGAGVRGFGDAGNCFGETDMGLGTTCEEPAEEEVMF